MRTLLPLACAWALASFLATGCDDDCASVRCGCDFGSTVIVTVVGAADGTPVTADTLMCADVSAETARCTDTSARPPQRATISAEGYEPATVTLVDEGGTCCTCYEGAVTLVTAIEDGGTGSDT